MMLFAQSAGVSRRPVLWQGHKVCFTPCVIGGGGRVKDLSASGFDFTGSGAYTIAGSPIGHAIVYAGNHAHIQTATSAGLPAKFCADSIEDLVVIQAYFKFNHSGSAKKSTLYWSDVPTLGSAQYGYRLYVDNNTDKLVLMVANGDNFVTTFPTYYTSATTLTTGRWYHAVAALDPYWIGDVDIGQHSLFWIDGVRELPVVTYSLPSGVEEYCAHLSTQNARVGATLGDIAPDVSIALVNVWNRRMPDAEVAILNADPLAMFRRRRMSGAKGSRLVSIGGSALRRMNIAISG